MKWTTLLGSENYNSVNIFAFENDCSEPQEGDVVKYYTVAIGSEDSEILYVAIFKKARCSCALDWSTQVTGAGGSVQFGVLGKKKKREGEGEGERRDFVFFVQPPESSELEAWLSRLSMFAFNF